jgi:alpha-N-arabinofuranosidase
MHDFPGGDSRFYNNIFISPEKPVPWPESIPERLNNQLYFGLATYDAVKLPVYMEGNVFLGQAEPSKHEENPLVQPEVKPGLILVEKPDGWYLRIEVNKSWADHKRPLVTTEMLGKAEIPNLPYEEPDGKPYRLDTDYFNKSREKNRNAIGPFATYVLGDNIIKLWPKKCLSIK